MKKSIKYLIVLLAILGCQYNNAQVGMNGNNPDKSSVLDLSAVNKGFLAPRLSSSQRDAIVNPAISLLIYNNILL